MRYLITVFVGLAFIACSSDDPPKPPEAASLVFPEQNSECTTGVDQSETTSLVEFRWQAAENTDIYELRVTQLGTSITQSASTSGTSASVVLQKGTPYSWMVISTNAKTTDAVSSSTWQFYNAGAQTSYAPFPALIVSPGSGQTVIRNNEGEVLLDWSGADVDNDIAGYDVYHGAVDPPTELLTSTTPIESDASVAVDPGTYFWRVVTRDDQGNTSDSGVYSYRAL